MAKIATLLLCASLCAESLEDTVVVLHVDGYPCSLTAHGLPPNANILKELAYMGIGYTFNAPFYPNLEAKAPILPWDGGIMFISDFNQKAKVFLKWLEISEFRPSNIVIVDSGESPLSEEVLKDLAIPYRIFNLRHSQNGPNPQEFEGDSTVEYGAVQP